MKQLKERSINPVEAAFNHVQKMHPEVTHVFYGNNGQFLYANDNFQPAVFTGEEDVDLLVTASAAVEDYWPCAYYFGSTEDERPADMTLPFSSVRKGEVFQYDNQDYCKISSKKAVCVSLTGEKAYALRVYFGPDYIVEMPPRLLK